MAARRQRSLWKSIDSAGAETVYSCFGSSEHGLLLRVESQHDAEGNVTRTTAKGEGLSRPYPCTGIATRRTPSAPQTRDTVSNRGALPGLRAL